MDVGLSVRESLGLDSELGGAGELSSLVDPAPGGEPGDVEEGDKGDPHRLSGSVVGGSDTVGDRSLRGREDGSSGDSHDKESGGSSGVSTEVLGGDDEDDGVLYCARKGRQVSRGLDE